MAASDGVRSPGSIVQVKHSWLAEPDLTRWIDAAYGPSAGQNCLLVSESLNQTYRLTGNGPAQYLRLSRAGTRTLDDVAGEAALVSYLHGRGLRVAAPVRRLDGGFAGEIVAPEALRIAILYGAATGDGVRDITPAHCRAYGRLAASIHAAADMADGAFDRFALDTVHLISEPLAAVQTRMEDEAPEDVAFLSEIAARITPRIDALPRTRAVIGICHGDLHPGNVRFDAGWEPTVFDFDCYGPGWRAYDLAVFLWNSYLERRSKAWRSLRWNAFLRGYREVRPMSAGEIEAVPLFLVARQIWLMGLDCEGKSGWLPQWIAAGWLRSMTGYIRAWVEEYPSLR